MAGQMVTSTRPERSGRFMRALGAALVARRSLRYEITFALSAIVISTGLRHALNDILPPGFPFLTFFPAVMLTLVLSSLRSGIVVGVVCGLIALHSFIEPVGRLSLDAGSVLALGFYTLIIATEVVFITAARRALLQRLRAEARATHLAHARSLMFSELQHRISNNLSTVAALLRLQSQQITDETARHALLAAQSRIRSISLLQRRLHAPDMQDLDAADYLRDVLADVVEVAGAGDVQLEFSADSLPLPHDSAVPLGLIASELVMNAIEHAAAQGRVNHVTARLKVDGPAGQGRTAATLEIRDRGPGLPDGFALERSESLGLIVARQFATALNGELSLKRHPQGGTVARLGFAVDPPQGGLAA